MIGKIGGILLFVLLVPGFALAGTGSDTPGTLVIGKELIRMMTARRPGGAPSSQDPAVKIAAEHGVAPQLVRSIIRVESNGNPTAVSPKGAMGLMQLMPETARENGVSNPFDPISNIHGGVRYLKKLLDDFSGNVSLALAAYNAGPETVRKYQGIPPYEETRQFVKKVEKAYRASRPMAAPSPAEQNVSRREFPVEKIFGTISFQGSPRELAFFLRNTQPMEATE